MHAYLPRNSLPCLGLHQHLYNDRSINKLQNDIILLIFKIGKFGNIRFVGNLIVDIYCIFYDDDVITVTSLVLRTQSVSALIFCRAVFFYNSQVLNSNASYKKRKQVQQANTFKRQTFKHQTRLNIKHV